jgi:two-component system sensor histidine kinase KdpD
LRAADNLKVAEMRARTEATRSALLSSVSRDLRTPLANITEAATLLRDDTKLLDPTQRTPLVVTVCAEAERMEQLIAKLLEMTQLESGEHVLQRIWLPCEELVGAALGIVQDKIANLTIRTDIPANLPLIAVEPPLMEHLLANIFENAVNYAGPRATVDIAAHSAENALVVEIADNGPGIPIGTEERIFEKFFRASKSERGGSGLGLAICRAIIEIHGGSISAFNRASGGAVFRVTIPVVGTPPELPSEQELSFV